MSNKIKHYKTRKVYVFDLEGKLVDVVKNVPLITTKYSLSKNYLYVCVREKRCVRNKLYFSYSNTFTFPRKKYNHNPLLKKHRTNKNISPTMNNTMKEADNYFRSSEPECAFC